MNSNNNSTGKINLDQLVCNLKKEDARYASLSETFQMVFRILISVYSLVSIVVLVETKDIIQAAGFACFLLSMLIFAIFFGRYHKEYKYVDYSLPTIKMLKNAAYRYQPFQFKTIWLWFGVLLMDASFCLNPSINLSLLKIQIYFIVAMIVAISIGLIIWYFKYKPLRDDALRLIKEIES